MTKKDNTYLFPKPITHKLNRNMSTAHKMNIIRKRLHSGNYFPHRHKDAPREKSFGYKAMNGKSSRYKINDMEAKDNYSRLSATPLEIEMRWLGLCQVLSYFGGNKKMLANLVGMALPSINYWIESGKVSPLGAHLLGESPEIPLTRMDIRPDITEKGWAKFDLDLPKKMYALEKRRGKPTARAAINEEDTL